MRTPQRPVFSVGTLFEEPDSSDDSSPSHFEIRRRSRGGSISSTSSSSGSTPSSSAPSTPIRPTRYFHSSSTSSASASSYRISDLRYGTPTSSNHLSFSSSLSSGSLSLLPPYAAAPYSSPADGKSVLTMDGGGVRGIFAPLFLIELQKHLPNDVDARSLLDLVGGTSTGGVAALMYARLGVTPEECLAIYEEMPRKLFAKRGKRLRRLLWLFTSAQHSSARQKKIFERVVRDVEGDADAMLKISPDDQDYLQNQCPVFVVCVDVADVSKPKVFSSYSATYTTVDEEEGEPISIVKAALATSAAPTYYLPAEHAGHSYLDGGMGYNNPSEIAVKQLTKVYGPSAYAVNIISLGTGVRNAFPFSHSRKSFLGFRSGLSSMFSILSTLAVMSTDSESVHRRMIERFEQTNAYFRFNPPGLETIELDDWQSVGRAKKICQDYLALPETQARLIEVAQRLLAARAMPNYF
ncbi:FabD/lysophospholipase-like protein [Schizopora paradoxa]|uniref:FabD/lysophospholipase-like protein n=1 Tax=Schizopora paradoxa TaxID=27342 RepID=A0A0H2RWL3_9AGAM|nr:FabD/lysophospholipase-like protein [Schizopora paradoxa]